MRVETPRLEVPLSLDAIRRCLFTYTVGRRLVLHDAVTSTNAVLRELARAGAVEGTVVLAECQTAGRGRAGTAWFSPPGVNVYLSALFRPAIPLASAAPFTFMGSLALVDAIRELGLNPAIKWPNDVLVGGKKVAGVMAELDAREERVRQAILGIGVNVNVGQDVLRAALGDAAGFATSLREARREPIDRNAFAASVLTYLDDWLVVFRDRGAPALLRAWRDFDIVTGRRVEIRSERTVFDGRARGVDEEGCLAVEDAGGRVHRVTTGQLRLLE